MMRQRNQFPEVTEADMEAARVLRHDLHRRPEISGQEFETSDRIAQEMRKLGADEVLTRIGGHGLVAMFHGPCDGPTVMLRAELDALPIQETSGLAHASEVPGSGHLCGHDGHMAILFTVARALARQRPERGRVALLFQPAEETGAGAAAMLDDPRLAMIAPDRIFALHNLPGHPAGQVALAEGPIACASRGMRIGLHGRTAHASQPGTGRSPRSALAQLLVHLDELNAHLPLENPRFAMVTVTHCRMGEPAFGVAPGGAEIWATLRTLLDEKMETLCRRAEALATAAASAAGLEISIGYKDVFQASANHPDAVCDLREALKSSGVPHSPDGQPWAPSEDFGRFSDLGPSAMFFLGAGEDCAALHDESYDFPDSLTETGAGIFLQTLRRALRKASA